MGLESLVKLVPGTHIAAEYKRPGRKDYWLAFEWDATKAITYATIGLFGYAYSESIIGILRQNL